MCTIYSTYIKMHKNTQTPSCAPARSRADIRNPLRCLLITK